METFKPELDAPAIRALGPLFKLTEVFLWDDDSVPANEVLYSPDRDKLSCDENDKDNVNIVSTTSDCSSLIEDTELAKQMDALGLPLSFLTNKEKRNGVLSGNRKSTRKKHLNSHINRADAVKESIKVSEGEISFPNVFNDNTGNSLCCMSVMGHSESSSCYDVAVDVGNCESSSDAKEYPASLTTRITGGISQEHICDDGTSEIVSNNGPDSNFVCTFVAKDDIEGAASLINLGVGTSLEHFLTDAGVDDCKKKLDGDMKHDYLESSSLAFHVAECEKLCDNISSEQLWDADAVAFSQSTHDQSDSYNCYGAFGDWNVYWDSFYLRNYFYNIKTHESTWYPPLGVENLASDDNDIIVQQNEMISNVAEMDVSPTVSSCCTKPADSCGWKHETDSSEESLNDYTMSDQPPDELLLQREVGSNNSISGTSELTVNSTLERSSELCEINKGSMDGIPSCILSDAREHNNSSTIIQTKPLLEDNGSSILHQGYMTSTTDKLGTQHESFARKRMKKGRRVRPQRKLSKDHEEFKLQGIVEDFSANITKYWWQRYLLFSKFDDGIKMDEEGWYSVTPEPIARHHASRCGNGIIIDCFSGVGGNTIQFAQRSKHVIAIDIDQRKIDYARHNAAIYGVDEQIDFINGDFFVLSRKLKADTLFLSPPWGGPDYAKVDSYDIKMLKPRDGHFLFNVAKEIASNIVMFLPRNVDLNQLAEISLSANPPWSLEVEKNYLNGKFKAVTAYFSDSVV